MKTSKPKNAGRECYALKAGELVFQSKSAYKTLKASLINTLVMQKDNSVFCYLQTLAVNSSLTVSPKKIKIHSQW